MSGAAAQAPPAHAAANARGDRRFRFAKTAGEQALLAIGIDPPQFADVNGVSLRYQLTGKQGAPVVVLAHEVSSNLQIWDYVVPALRDRYRLLRFDWRGFGMSEKVRRSFGLDEVLGDVTGLLDRLGISESVVLVGGSIGGAVMMQFAGHFPQRTRGVLAMIPGVGRIGIPYMPTTTSSVVVTESINEARFTTDALRDSEWPEVLRGPDRIERYNYWRGMKLGNDPVAWRNFGGATNYDHRPNFAKILCPTTLVGATMFKDPRPPEQVKWVAEQINGAKYVEVNSSHYMAYQTPELFIPVLEQFLREVTG
jgi:3-oxoadipate enol-lactonase